MPSDNRFEPLSMSVLTMTEACHTHYRVYKSAEEFVAVDAPTAYEAVEKSGIAHPYKIQHILRTVGGILDESLLVPLKEESHTQEEHPVDEENPTEDGGKAAQGEPLEPAEPAESTADGAGN